MIIHSMTTEKGKKYYFTYMASLLKDENKKPIKDDKGKYKKTYAKILVGFKKEQEMVGVITPTEWDINYDVIETERKAKIKETGEEKDAIVEIISPKIMIWAYTKTEADLRLENSFKEKGKKLEHMWSDKPVTGNKNTPDRSKNIAMVNNNEATDSFAFDFLNSVDNDDNIF